MWRRGSETPRRSAMPKRITEDEARRRLEGRDDVKLVEYVGTAKDAEADAKFTEAMLGFGFVLCMVGIVFLVSFPKVD